MARTAEHNALTKKGRKRRAEEIIPYLRDDPGGQYLLVYSTEGEVRKQRESR